MSNQERLDELKERINTMKNTLYKELITYDANHSPKDLEPLNEFIFYFLKVMQFWKDIFYNKYTNPISVPKNIEKIVSENTKWVEENIINSNDRELCTMAMYEISKNIDKNPLILK
jgi:hypothetical protein